MASDFTCAAKLVDGATVLIRRLGRDDYDSVVNLAAGLTGEERYLRFFTVHPTHIDNWAHSLTTPADGIVALGVFEDQDLLGVANYVELPERGDAEIAVVVAHEQHDRGVGTLLLRTLGRIAREAGLHRFVADVLVENLGMRRVLREVGWPMELHRDGAVIRIEIDLDSIEDKASVEHGAV